MLFAFIDESYTSERYYVAAFVIDADEIESIGGALSAAADYAMGFGVPFGAEFHGHRIMSGRDGWEAIRSQARAAGAIYRRALRDLASLNAKLFIEGVDIERLNRRYPYPDPPHLIALRHVLEQVQIYAERCREQVVVVCDEINDSDAHERMIATYRRIGTPGYRTSKLDRIGDLLFGRSDGSPGLQAADLCVYIFRRVDAHQAGSERAARLARSLLNELSPILVRARRWDP